MSLMRRVMIVVWLVAGAYGMPNLIAYNTTQVMDHSSGDGDESGHLVEFCMNSANINLHIIVLINFLLLYCVPLLLITVMYTRISVVLWKSSCRLETNGETKKTLANNKRLSQGIDASVTNESEASSSVTDATSHASGRNTISGQTRDSTDNVSLRNTHSIVNEGSKTKHLATVSVIDQPTSKKGRFKNKITFRHTTKAQIAGSDGTETNNSIVGNGATDNQHHFTKRRVANKTFHPTSRNALRARRKVIRLLIAIVVSFAACMLPHHVRLLYEMWAPLNYHPSFAQLLLPPCSFLLFYLNSALNPILYAFLSDNFKNSLKELLGFRRRKAAWNRKTFSQKSFLVTFHRSTSPKIQSNYEWYKGE